MLYLTCGMISSIDLAHYGLFLAKNGFFVDCGTSSYKSESHDENSDLVSEHESMSVTDHVGQCPTFLCFTDFMILLSLYMGDRHATLHTLTSGQDHFATAIHVWIGLKCLLH